MRFFVLATFIALAFSLSHSNSYYKSKYDSYLNKFNKEYSQQEYRYRLSIFSENVDFIESENKKGHSYTLGLTSFADISNEEYRARRSCSNMEKQVKEASRNVPNKVYEDLPESVDWRAVGAVTPVRDQNGCGSDWAISATACMEYTNFNATGKLIQLSIQQLIDCDQISVGCRGGLMSYAFRYVTENLGICAEEDYPYTAKDGECDTNKCYSKGHISDYVVNNFFGKGGKPLKEAISEHVSTISLDSKSESFQHYTSGIFDATDCGHKVDLGAAGVGYGKEGDKEYFIVKVPFGTQWGEEGYMRLAYQDEGWGTCGENISTAWSTW
ncbi:hypothetical protein WA158_000779 [Blastocystis sp. Blastoise]